MGREGGAFSESVKVGKSNSMSMTSPRSSSSLQEQDKHLLNDASHLCAHLDLAVGHIFSYMLSLRDFSWQSPAGGSQA